MHALREHILNTGRPAQQAAFDLLRKTKKRWVGKGLALQAAPHTPRFIKVKKVAVTDTPPVSPLISEPTPHKKLRFCVITSKKTCAKAVDRNRLRRRLRAAALEILPLHAPYDMDYMLVGRVGGLKLPFDALKKEIIWCLKKLDLTSENKQ